MTVESHVVCTMSAPCKTCARYTEPVHVVREVLAPDERLRRYTSVSVAHLFCSECCPACCEKRPFLPPGLAQARSQHGG